MEMQYKQSVFGMKVSLIICMMVFLGLPRAYAQDSPAVLEIRASYNAFNEGIRQCEDAPDNFCGYYLNSSQVNVHNGPWRAVGIYQSDERFWGQPQENEGIDNDKPVLRKVEIQSVRSARQEVEEFFFDEAGKLSFYFFKMESEDRTLQEYRFYFKAGKLVDYKEKVDPAELQYQNYHKADFEAISKDAQRLIAAYRASFR
jgi:hypothetical protein